MSVADDPPAFPDGSSSYTEIPCILYPLRVYLVYPFQNREGHSPCLEGDVLLFPRSEQAVGVELWSVAELAAFLSTI